MIKIAYIFLPGRIDRLAKIDSHKLPTDFFYGAIELREKGYHIDVFEVDERPRRGLIRFIAEHALKAKYLPVKTYTSILDAVWHLLPELRQYDVVVATTTGIAFSLAFWKVAYRLSFSVIGIMNAILNYQLNYSRVLLSRFLLNRMDVHLFGEGELEPICREYRIAKNQVTVNYFGVDCRFWQCNSQQESEGYLLAVGNDSMRDFSVLIELAERIKRKIILVTRREISGAIPSNIHIIRGAWHSRELDDVTLRDMYHKAFCVITPLKESYQPSGQSVTLQAMACGKPVILTKTSGLWDKRYLEHRKNILFVEPGAVSQIIACLQELENDSILRNDIGRNARNYVFKNAQIDFFAERLEQSILKLCISST